MSLLDSTKQRIKSLVDEIDGLSQSEFAYPDSKAALDLLKAHFDQRLQILDIRLSTQSDPAVVSAECSQALTDVWDNVPLLGFILRSTNVRNAFEVYGPLLRLAKDLLGAQTKLILSSEWDYSPISYGHIPSLPGFVLIGLPAPESGNPLLVPLAGHELGHLLWEKADDTALRSALVQGIIDQIKSRLAEYTTLFPNLAGLQPDQLTKDMFAVESWQPALTWAEAQAEETFCDLVGLLIFGTSYLHAFAYLLAPNAGGSRAPKYPNYERRATDLKDAADSWKIPVPGDFEGSFDDLGNPFSSAPDQFRLDLADAAAIKNFPTLCDEAKRLVGATAFVGSEAKALEYLRNVVPCQDARSIAEILNAAWTAALDPNLWTLFPHLLKKRELVLRDLVLKSIEVFEIERRMGNGP